MFPLPLAYLMTTPAMMEQYIDKADAFDGLFNMVLGYGIQFLLPCIIGVVAAMLFLLNVIMIHLKILKQSHYPVRK